MFFYDIHTIQTSTNPTFRAVGDSMIEFSKTDPEVMNPSVGAHINKVMAENYAWIGNELLIFTKFLKMKIRI